MTLFHLRKRAKETQSKLAKALLLDQTTVSKYEKGKILPPIIIIPKLAELLNCSIEELVFAIIETQKQEASA